MNHSLQKMLFSLIVVLSFQFSANAQVTNVESFTALGFPPVGWTTIDGAAPLWSRRTTGTFPTCLPLTDPGMARFASRTATLGIRQTIGTPRIDYSGRGSATPTLSLWVYRDTSRGSDSLILYVNTAQTVAGATVLGVISRNINDSLPVRESATEGWFNYTFSIPSGFTTDTNYILVQGCANRGANIYIDSLVWDSYPPICVGTPNVGDLVLNKHLICGGTGDVNLSLTSPIALSGITYQWASAPSAAGPWTNFGGNFPTTNSGTITTTTYFQCTVTCSDTSALPYVTAYDSCLVSTGPAPVLVFDPIAPAFCTGDAGVSVTVSGAATYVWTPGATLSDSLSDSVFASPTRNTRYTVRGTDSFGCTVTANINVAVQNPPMINVFALPSDTVCEGNLAVLAAFGGGGGGGTTYEWSDGTLGNRDSIYPMADGTYDVTATTSAGCSATASIDIFVVPLTVADFTYTVSGTTVTFSDNSLGASGVTWDFGDGNSSTSANPVYTYSTAGTYSVTLTALSSGCGDDVIVTDIIVNPNGINNIANNNPFRLSVAPNPVEDMALINYSTTTTTSLVMTNALGEKVYNTELKASNNNKQTIDMSAMKSGLYFIQMTNQSATSTAKVMKK
jgi:PKD repeat protein